MEDVAAGLTITMLPLACGHNSRWSGRPPGMGIDSQGRHEPACHAAWWRPRPSSHSGVTKNQRGKLRPIPLCRAVAGPGHGTAVRGSAHHAGTCQLLCRCEAFPGAPPGMRMLPENQNRQSAESLSGRQGSRRLRCRGFRISPVPWSWRAGRPPQAGLAVYERGPDGLLAAARVYDDVEAPVEHPAADRK